MLCGPTPVLIIGAGDTALAPDPGPPWRNTTGMPAWLPEVSQYIEWIASSGSVPRASAYVVEAHPQLPVTEAVVTGIHARQPTARG